MGGVSANPSFRNAMIILKKNFHSKKEGLGSSNGMENSIYFSSFSTVTTSLSLRTGRLERTDHTITECCSAPVSPDPT